MYKCNFCCREFENPKVEAEVIGNSDKTGVIQYYYCPYCDSSNIEYVKLDRYYLEVAEDDE